MLQQYGLERSLNAAAAASANDSQRRHADDER